MKKKDKLSRQERLINELEPLFEQFIYFRNILYEYIQEDIIEENLEVISAKIIKIIDKYKEENA